MKKNSDLSNGFSLLQTDEIAKTDLSTKKYGEDQFHKHSRKTVD